MTTVFVTGIGGSIGIDVARSLRRDPSVRIVGSDGSPWGRRLGRRLCDEVVSLPRADRDPLAWMDALDAALHRAGADFVFVNPDPELEAIAAIGRLPACRHAIPPPRVTGTCLDKAATVEAGRGSSDFPVTRQLRTDADVDAAFAELHPPLWLRATTGPGGRGSIPVEIPEEIRAWIAYWRRRGRADRWVVQELLPGRNLNWTGLYREGELLVSTSMERLAYFLGATTVSGVSGQVSLCATVDPRPCTDIADRVVRLLDAEPHGLHSVDLREDREGRPRVTEVNPRLAGRPWLYTEAGVNLPLATIRALGGAPGGADLGDAVAPSGLRVGLHLHRQLDVDPVVGEPEA